MNISNSAKIPLAGRMVIDGRQVAQVDAGSGLTVTNNNQAAASPAQDKKIPFMIISARKCASG